MQILGCQTTDLKMFSIAKSACLRYIMRKNLKNFPGAAPPDPCRSSIGALMRTSLARSAALRAASRRAPRNTLCRFAAMLQNKTYLAEHFWALPSLARATSRELDLHRRKIFVNLNFKL